MKMNRSRSFCWSKFKGFLVAVAFLLIMSGPVTVNAAKGGSIVIGTTKNVQAGLYYEVKTTVTGFYKFTAVSSDTDNEVVIYDGDPENGGDYYDDFRSEYKSYLQGGTTFYIRSDYDAAITVATFSPPALQMGKADQIVEPSEYYTIVSPKNCDYVISIASLETDTYVYAYLDDEELNDLYYRSSDNKTISIDCILKANKTYYLYVGRKAKVSIRVGEVGNSRDALVQQLASATAARKAALAKLVAPKKVAIKSLKAGKKSMLVKWKKVKGISGYELQYGLNKSFTKGQKIIKVKKTKISRKITKLTSKKKYYVRIRAYKSITGGTIYGKWSKVKVKKVK